MAVLLVVTAVTAASAAPANSLYHGESYDGYDKTTMTSTNLPCSIIAVLGTNGVVIADGEAASADKGADFGLWVTNTVTTNWFCVTNSGSADMTISSVTMNGASAAQFSIGGVPSSVAAGTASNFWIAFAPSSIGVQTAVVSIANSSPSTPYRVNVKGTGNPAIIATAGAHGIITPSGTVAVPYGGTTNFVVSADYGYWISSLVTNGVTVSVAAGLQIYTSQWQNVTTLGSITATFTYVINRFAGGECDGYDKTTMTGTNLPCSIIAVLGTNGVAIADGEAASFDKGADFGLWVTNTVTTNWFWVTNSGSSDMTISSVTMNGASAAQFSIGGVPTGIAAGTASNFWIAFTPASVGVQTAVVSIANNSTSTPYRVNIKRIFFLYFCTLAFI